MEYVSEDSDYNVAELYLNFQTRFPVLVKVTEGFCGSFENTFDKGEIFLIAAVLKQTRVVAKMNIQGRCRILSIPATFPEDLCIVRRWRKPMKPSKLSDIVSNHELPLTVQFPPDHITTAKAQSINTNSIPPIELENTFEETYLLGNLITEGRMDAEVLQIPLYLSQLRFSPVTGLKRQSDKEWLEFQERVFNESRCISYDLRVGNQNIAEYETDIAVSDTQFNHKTPVFHEYITQILETVPYVQIRKRPVSDRNTNLEVSTKSHKSVRELVQEWTNKITSKLKTKDGKQNRHLPPTTFSEKEVNFKTNSNEDIDQLFQGNGAHHSTQKVRKNFRLLKDSEDDLKTFDKLGTGRYMKSLKFRKHKISREISEESDENELMGDIFSGNSPETRKEILEDRKYTKTNINHEENDGSHATAEKMADIKQSQKAKHDDVHKDAMVEEWLDKIPQTKQTTEFTILEEPTVYPKLQKIMAAAAPTKPISPELLQHLKTQIASPSIPNTSGNNPKHNVYLQPATLPKSFAQHDMRTLNHSPVISPKSLSKFYLQSTDRPQPIPPISLRNFSTHSGNQPHPISVNSRKGSTTVEEAPTSRKSWFEKRLGREEF